jgi:hypothetical protein
MADKKKTVKVQKWKKSKVKKLNKWLKVKKKKDLINTWSGKGWNAQVIQNEDGGGWAVEMRRDGDDDPVYVAPWTMGRNKVDPKPLSLKAFNTWVKSASEFLMRSQHQTRTADRSTVTITTDEGESLKIIFDIERGDYDSTGVLIAEDLVGEEVARVETYSTFVLDVDSAEEWARAGFESPRPSESEAPQPSEWDEEDSQVEPGYDEDPESVSGDEPAHEEEYEVEYVDYDNASGYEEPVFEYD